MDSTSSMKLHPYSSTQEPNAAPECTPPRLSGYLQDCWGQSPVFPHSNDPINKTKIHDKAFKTPGSASVQNTHLCKKPALKQNLTGRNMVNNRPNSDTNDV